MTFFSAIKAGEGFFSLSLGGPFERQLRAFRRNVRTLGDLGGGLTSLGNTFSNLGAKLTGVSVGLAGIFGAGIGLAAAAEQAEVAFTTLLGSAEKARDLMAQLSRFAAETPFQLPDLRDAARLLAAFGVEGEAIIPTLRMLGDLSAGTGNRIDEIAEIFGKARVQGRLFGEDINQLTGRGIPVIGALARTMGVAEDQIKKLVSQGKIGFPELQQAFVLLTAEGGQFTGMMRQLSRTAAGSLSTLKDNFAAVAMEIGAAFLPIVTELSGELTELAKPIGAWIRSNRELITQLGMYVPKALAAGGSLIGLGVAMSTAGSVITGTVATISAALTLLASPAGPIVVATAALAGLAGGMPSVREKFGVALAQMQSAAETTIGGIVAAFRDGSIEDAATIAAEGMRVTFETALRAMKIGLKEFQAESIKATLQAAQFGQFDEAKLQQERREGKPLTTFGPAAQGLLTLRAEIKALEMTNQQQLNFLRQLPDTLAKEREARRTAEAVEELVRLSAIRGAVGLPVVP